MAERTSDIDTAVDGKGPRAVTGIGAIVVAVVVLVGLLLIGYILFWPSGGRQSGGVASENTSTRPAEP